MARFLKNPQLAPGATGAVLPIVLNNSYGDAPVPGLIRFNSGNNRIEFYYNNAWSQVAKIGTVQIAADTLGPGDGTTTNFTMTQSETDPTAVAVFVGGVYQQPSINYTVAGTTITFNTAPPKGSLTPTTITVIHNFNSTNVPA
jgi:hypothetical protein